MQPPLKCGLGFKITSGGHFWARNEKVDWINQISQSVFLRFVFSQHDYHLYTKCIVAVRLAHSKKGQTPRHWLFFKVFSSLLFWTCVAIIHLQSNWTFALSNTHSIPIGKLHYSGHIPYCLGAVSSYFFVILFLYVWTMSIKTTLLCPPYALQVFGSVYKHS